MSEGGPRVEGADARGAVAFMAGKILLFAVLPLIVAGLVVALTLPQ